MTAQVSIDRDIAEENMMLLDARSRMVTDARFFPAIARWGMCAETVTEVRNLEPTMIERAADCLAPLFGFIDLDETVVQAIEATDVTGLPRQRDEVDAVIAEENLALLLTRWSSCKQSPVHAQAVFGLSNRLIDSLRRATISDLRRASRRGVRLGSVTVRAYFSDRGRLFQADRGRRIGVAVAALGKRAGTGVTVS